MSDCDKRKRIADMDREKLTRPSSKLRRRLFVRGAQCDAADAQRVTMTGAMQRQTEAITHRVGSYAVYVALGLVVVAWLWLRIPAGVLKYAHPDEPVAVGIAEGVRAGLFDTNWSLHNIPKDFQSARRSVRAECDALA